MGFFKEQLLGLALPLLTGPLAAYLSRFALNADKRIDALGREKKQAFVFVVSAVLTYVSQQYVPGFIPDGSPVTLATADWQLFASWVVGTVWHNNQKVKAKK